MSVDFEFGGCPARLISRRQALALDRLNRVERRYTTLITYHYHVISHTGTHSRRPSQYSINSLTLTLSPVLPRGSADVLRYLWTVVTIERRSKMVWTVPTGPPWILRSRIVSIFLLWC